MERERRENTRGRGQIKAVFWLFSPLDLEQREVVLCERLHPVIALVGVVQGAPPPPRAVDMPASLPAQPGHAGEEGKSSCISSLAPVFVSVFLSCLQQFILLCTLLFLVSSLSELSYLEISVFFLFSFLLSGELFVLQGQVHSTLAELYLPADSRQPSGGGSFVIKLLGVCGGD